MFCCFSKKLCVPQPVLPINEELELRTQTVFQTPVCCAETGLGQILAETPADERCHPCCMPHAARYFLSTIQNPVISADCTEPVSVTRHSTLRHLTP
mmetsp:Transcript_72629/g.130807  ORF Transcript_72629/g.130807 Transcript_72629/m.130807 type:complete len:97 (+) Transcript_72629:349-639(+)